VRVKNKIKNKIIHTHTQTYMKSSDAKASKWHLFFFNDDFYETCIFKFSNFT